MPKTKIKSLLLRSASFAQDTNGAAAIVMGLLSPVLLFGVAFASEAAFWELTKRRLQNAADVAVYAAGTQLRSGYDEAAMKNAALIVAEDSGYKGGVAGITVAQLAATGGGDLVQIVLTEEVERSFSKLFRNNGMWAAQGDDSSKTVTISTAATAQVVNGRPACILALHPSTSDAISVTGNTSVGLTGCDVAANSISQQAVTTQGNSADMTTDCISAVGGVDLHNPANVTLNDCSSPIENSAVTADPYRNRPAPPVDSTLCVNNATFNNDWQKKNGRPETGNRYCASGNVTINDSLTVKNNVGSDWIILDGGTWKFNATSEFNAVGVTLYLTNGATLDINGSATFNISAPLTGDYRGLAVYMDRADSESHLFNGGAGFSIVGAIYGTNSDITISGNVSGSGPGECTQIIGSTVTLTGSSDFDTDCSASGTEEIVTAASISIVG